jgi:hypothetical protein
MGVLRFDIQPAGARLERDGDHLVRLFNVTSDVDYVFWNDPSADRFSLWKEQPLAEWLVLVIGLSSPPAPSQVSLAPFFRLALSRSAR